MYIYRRTAPSPPPCQGPFRLASECMSMLPVILADEFMLSVLADIQFPVECSPAVVKNTDVYKYVPNINTFIITLEYAKTYIKMHRNG